MFAVGFFVGMLYGSLIVGALWLRKELRSRGF